MISSSYARGRWIARVALQDGVLLLALALSAWTGGPWGAALGIGVVATLAWGVATLHFPERIEVGDDAITFRAYGRTHEFRWSDVTRIRVRRFLVKDRVLVRLAPSSAFRGRYWLTDGLDGYDALVRELERRAAAGS